jgi:pimeloyl-ACP methyl ester carboxylesterase
VGIAPRLRSIAAIAAVLLVACTGTSSSTNSAAVAASDAVSFKTADGVDLSGRIFGPANATAGVVLAHTLSGDQTKWFGFADRLAGQGFRVLTFDFRGYCPGGDGGCSGGTEDVDAAPTDLAAAVKFLRADGVQRLGIAGASMGGTAALLVASADGEGIPALVLSAPQVLYGLEVGSDVLQTVIGAKLYIAGLGDPAGAAAAADAMAALGPQPVREEIVTADEHGTALLNSTSGEQVQELMEQWFGRYLAQRPTPSEAA